MSNFIDGWLVRDKKHMGAIIHFFSEITVDNTDNGIWYEGYEKDTWTLKQFRKEYDFEPPKHGKKVYVSLEYYEDEL